MKDLTQGPIVKLLLNLAGTFMISSILSTLLSLANIFWVGRLGAHAQAAMALALNPIMIVLALGPIISVGVRVLTAQAVGASDRDRACVVVNEGFSVALIAGIVIGAGLWLGRSSLVSLLTSDPETAALTAAYFRWLIPAIALQLPIAVLGAALGGTGNVRANMLIQTGAMAFSVVASPFLMFGWLGAPKMGLEGAGVSTLMSSTVCMCTLLYFYSRPGSYLRMRPGIWLSRPTMLWRALGIGLPSGIEGALLGAYLMVLMLLLRRFGPHEIAAFGIGQRLLQAGIMPLMALGGAASLVAAQNFGARSHQRVRETFKTSLTIGLVVSPVLWLLVLGLAYPVCRAFSKDPAVVDAAVALLRIISFSLIPASVALTALSVLAGLGNTRASLMISVTHVVLVAVPSVALARMHGFSPDWLWMTMVVASFFEMAMALYFLHSEFGKRLNSPALTPVMGLDSAS